MQVRITDLDAPIGAEVTGVDFSQPVRDDIFAGIEAAFEDRSVLVFRDAIVTDDQQVAFSQRFGALEESLGGTRGEGSYFAMLRNVDDDGNLIDPDSQRMQFSRANEFWHTDSSFKPAPAKASLLSARRIPPTGGETEFASGRLAYDTLPSKTRKDIDDLICEHDLARSREMVSPGAMTAAQKALYPPVHQRMVRANPANGRKNLFLGAHVTRVIGMNDDAGRALVDDLMDRITAPENVYRHVWRENDMVMWDNRCILHRGRPWDQRRHARVMQRTTVAGEAPTVPADYTVDA